MHWIEMGPFPEFIETVNLQIKSIAGLKMKLKKKTQ